MLNLCACPLNLKRKTKLKLIGVTFELKRLHLPSVTLFYLEHDEESTFYIKNVEKIHKWSNPLLNIYILFARDNIQFLEKHIMS